MFFRRLIFLHPVAYTELARTGPLLRPTSKPDRAAAVL